MRRILACLLLCLALPAGAQIYKYIDANGNTVFTNQPPEGVSAESIELPPTNTMEMPAPSAPTPTARTDRVQSAPYRILQLTGLPDAEALRANDGTFGVGVQLEPALAPAHRLRLLLDGQAYGPPSKTPQLQLTNIDRGEHRLAVEVLSAGKPIQRSATVSFTVQRVNTSSPALRPPPPPKPAP